MATVVNFIDVTLRGAAARTVNLASAQILLTASAPAFHVAADGAITPPSITFTATRIDVDAPLTFNCTGGTLSGATATTVTLAGADMVGTSATVIASAVVNGETYTGPCTISKFKDGKDGVDGDGANLTPGDLKAILEGQLTTDQLDIGLRSRIGLIDAGTDTAGSVAARVKAETDQRIAAISQLTTDNRTYVQQYTYSQQTINDSLSAFGTNIQAAYQGYANGAADGALTAAKAFTQSYGYSKADADGALNATATQLRSEFTSLNQGTGATVAWVQQYTYSRAEADAAIASSTQQLSTTVNGHTTTLEIQAQSIGGLGAQIVNKIDNNGYVSGYGLASTPINGVPQSSFIVLADRFAVALPGQAAKYPFVIGTVNGQTVIGLRGDVVLDGTLAIRATAGLSTAIDAAATTATTAGLDAGLGAANLIGKNTLPSDASTFTCAGSSGVDFEGPVYSAPDNEFAIYSPGRKGVVFMHARGIPPAGSSLDMYSTLTFDVAETTRYEAGVTLSTHRCEARAIIVWLNASGGYINESAGNPVLNSYWNVDSITLPSRSVVTANAPAGAKRAYVMVRQYHGAATTDNANPQTFTSQWYSASALPSQTVGSPWKPSPLEAQDLANAAKAAADAAAKAATDAQHQADAALARVQSISDDGRLDRSEKGAAEREYNDIYLEHAGIVAEANRLGVPYSDWESRYYELGSYLSSIPGWGDHSSDSSIDRATYNARFANYYSARQALLNSFTAKSKADANAAALTSTWAGTSGLGKPQDYATVGAPAGTMVGNTDAQTVADRSWLGYNAYDALPGINQQIADRLSKTSPSQLAATVTLATNGTLLAGTPDNGVYLTPVGLYCVQGGVIKVIVPITGDPTYAGKLLAAFGTFGAVSIAAGGSLSLQASSYNNDPGIWFGFVGGVPKFSIVAANGAKLLFDPSDPNPLQIKNANIANSTTDAFTGYLGGSAGGSFPNPSPAGSLVGFGSLTANAIGGTGAINYQWIITPAGRVASNAYMRLESSSGKSVGVVGTGSNTTLSYSVTCIMSDQGGRTVILSTEITASMGTPT